MARWKGLSKTVKIVIGIVVLIVLCGVVAQLGGGTDKTVTQAPAAQEGEAAATTEPAKEKPAEKPTEEAAQVFTVGDTMAVGNTAWKLAEATDLGQTVKSGNQFIQDLTTSGRFIEVKMVYRNDGKDSAFIDTPKIVDSTGREFDSSTDAIMIIDTSVQCVLEQVNPGVEKSCMWLYEVPADAAGLKLSVSSGMFGKKAQFDLGVN